jgi:predicted MFS family arabinose efflux permease
MLTALEAGFSVDQQQAAWAVSVFALAYGILQLFFGPLGDRFGKVRVIAIAALGCAGGNLATFTSNSFDQLLLARAISGAAAAGIVPLAMAWIGDHVGYERRQEILARLLGATVLGTIFGQWAGGAIPSVTNWRATFLVLSAVFGASGIWAFAGARIRSGWVGPVQAQFVSNTVSVIRTPWARVVLVITLIEGCLAYSALAFLPTHIHEATGLPVPQAGLAAGLYGIGGLIYSRAAKVLLRYLAESGLAMLGALLMALSFGVLSVSHQLVLSLFVCLVAGFGFYVLHNTLQLNATQMSPRCRGTAVSLFACFLFIGQSIGVVSGALFIQQTSTSALFALNSVGLLAIGAIFSIRLRRRYGRVGC